MANQTIATVVAPASYTIVMTISDAIDKRSKTGRAYVAAKKAIEACTTIEDLKVAMTAVFGEAVIEEPILEETVIDGEEYAITITPVYAEVVEETPFEAYQRGTLEAVESSIAKVTIAQIDLRKKDKGRVLDGGLSNLSQALNVAVEDAPKVEKVPVKRTEPKSMAEMLAELNKAASNKAKELQAAEAAKVAQAILEAEAKKAAAQALVLAEATRIANALDTFIKDFYHKHEGAVHTRKPKGSTLDAIEVAPYLSVVRSGAYRGLTCTALIGKCMVLTPNQLALLRAIILIMDNDVAGIYTKEDATVSGFLVSDGRLIPSSVKTKLCDLLALFPSNTGKPLAIGGIKGDLKRLMDNLFRNMDTVALLNELDAKSKTTNAIQMFLCQQLLERYIG